MLSHWDLLQWSRYVLVCHCFNDISYLSKVLYVPTFDGFGMYWYVLVCYCPNDISYLSKVWYALLLTVFGMYRYVAVLEFSGCGLPSFLGRVCLYFVRLTYLTYIESPYSVTNVSLLVVWHIPGNLVIGAFHLFLLLLNFNLPGDLNFIEVCVEGCLCVLSV